MEPEFERTSQCTSEEDAKLQRSIKKFKDNASDRPFIPPHKRMSYKDSLLGDILGAYAQALRFDTTAEFGDESDTELDDLVDGMMDVHLSKETKACIRAPLTKALIVKVYDKTVGYNYLTFKINTLGKIFFLNKFHDEYDYDKVLRMGPWFVGEHFLAIKPWEPYFKASEASFSFVAIWVRFPELPIEFYDSSILREIGSAIGPGLRIDSYIASGSRGSYARMCIQIDLSKPLINTVRVGRLRQKVMYEGISSLCF